MHGPVLKSALEFLGGHAPFLAGTTWCWILLAACSLVLLLWQRKELLPRRDGARPEQTDWVHRYGFWMAVSPFVIIRLTHMGFLPFWDAGLYIYWLVKIITQGRSILDYCDAIYHPSPAFLGCMAVPLRLFDFHPFALNGTLLMFGLLALWGFWRCAGLFANDARAWQRILLTLAFSLNSNFLATSFHFSTDFGMISFFLPFLASACSGRFLEAALWGLMLTFTKEPGLPIAMIALGWLALVRPRFHPDSAPIGVVKCGILMATLTLLYGAYTLRLYCKDPSLFWAPNLWVPESLTLFLFSFWSPMKASYTLLAFVQNFLWWITLGLVLGLTGAAWRSVSILRARRALDWAGLNPRSPTLYLSLLLLSFWWLATRVTLWSNPRYVAFLIPVLFILSDRMLRRFVTPRILPSAWLCAYGLCIIPGNCRMLDPVSKRLWGTFKVGQREFLRIPSLTQEDGGPNGVDQIAYNLEFVSFHYLFNRVFEVIPPTPEIPYVVGPPLQHGCFDYMALKDGKRSLSPRAPLRPNIVPIGDVLLKNPAEFIMLDLPLWPCADESRYFEETYAVVGREEIRTNGLLITATRFQSRPPDADSP